MYTIDLINDFVIIDGKQILISEADEESVLLQPQLVEIHDLKFTVADYPKELLIEIHHETGFETYLFHEIHISKATDSVQLSFQCLQPNKYWKGTWGLSTFLATFHEIVKEYGGIKVEGFDIEDDWKELELSFF